MRARLLANEGGAIAGALDELTSGSARVSVAVAFARQSGLREVELLERGGPAVRFLAGTDFQQTELELFERLAAVPRCETRAFLGAKLQGAGAGRTFHPKVYYGEDGAGGAKAIVGSANFTRGGLRENHEAAVLLEGGAGEEPLADIGAYVARLWSHPFSVPITAEFKSRYADLRAAWNDALGAVFEGGDFQTALQAYRQAIGGIVVRPESAGTQICWLLVSNAANAAIVRQRGVWGNEKHGPIAKMSSGDPVVLYVKGDKRLGGWGLVNGTPYEDRTPLWPDGVYPYRIRVTFLGVPQMPVEMRPLAPALSFIGPAGARKWGTYLQTSQRSIPWPDFARLRDAIDGSRVPAAN